MFYSLSAVNKDSVVAFTKLAVLLGMSFQFEYSADTRRRMNQWLLEAEPFIKRFKFPQKELNAAVRALVANRDPNDDQTLDDNITEFMWCIYDHKKLFHSELDIPKVMLDMLDRIRLYVLKGSDNAFNFLAKNISELREPALSKIFVHEETDTSDVQAKLKKLVSKYAKSGMIMPAEQLAKFVQHNKDKGKRHPDHDNYLAYRRELNAALKARLATIIRESGKPWLPLVDVIKRLKAENVYNELPKTFVGGIDDQGRFYTTAGKRIAVTISGEVRMNPSYDPKTDNGYVCEYTPPFAQAPTRAYTVDFKQERVEKKYNVVGQVIGKLETLTGKWLKDLRKAPKTRESCLAVLCELIYETTARVGNDRASTDGKQTYGATQWRVKHVKLTATRCDIKYEGKSGVKQHHIIHFNTPRLKLLAEKLPGFLAGKKPDDFFITDKGKPLTSNSINRYLKYLGFPDGFTIHKLRTARGTEMAYNILKDAPFDKGADAKAVNTWVENEMLKVGKELGHISGETVTAATAIANYIDPSVLDDFFRRLNVRPSAKIQKAIDQIGKKV